MSNTTNVVYYPGLNHWAENWFYLPKKVDGPSACIWIVPTWEAFEIASR